MRRHTAFKEQIECQNRRSIQYQVFRNWELSSIRKLYCGRTGPGSHYNYLVKSLSFLIASVCLAQTREERISRAAEALHDHLIEQRRDFHMHPELSNREERTARVIAEKLRALGLDDVKTG